MIKPSRDAVKRIRKRLADEIRSQRGSNAMALIARLNPIIRGWAGYYRTVVAAKVFERMDTWMFHRAKRYATHTHPKKPWKWRKNCRLSKRSSI